jgi:hypothetical protein
MRIRTVVAVLAGASTLLLSAAPASATASHKQTLTGLFTTVNGVDWPVTAIGTGPVSGAATETQTMTSTAAGGIIKAVFHFAKGDFRVTFTETDTVTPDMTKCLATLVGTGTWVVTGGTGLNSRATGHGTFTNNGLIVGPRDATGACAGPESATPPPVVVARVVAVGTVNLHR